MPVKPTDDHRRMIPVKGHPGIFRRGNRYVDTWKYRGRTKKQSYRTLAQAVRGRAQRIAADGEPVGRQRFDAYARHWLNTYTGRTARGVGEGTMASYRDAIERKAIPHFGTARLGEITAPDVRDYVAELRREKLKARTIRRYLAPLRALFAQAVEDGHLAVNPTTSVRVVVPGERRYRPPTLMPDEIKRLVREIPEAHRELVMFLAYTGLRISEALAAVWGDLGQEGGRPVLFVPDSKTDAGVRSVPLAPDFNRRLMRRRASAQWAADDAPIFPSKVGTHIDRRQWHRRIWTPARERAGVKATPHTLRHSLASLLFEQGHNAAQVAAWIGHEDPSFTLRTYVHARDTGDADFLDDVLGGE
jgi:integrase